ncbi:hypothetical protein UlMin_005704 [Ulmus minor]
MATSLREKKLHILFIPFMAQGHLIPMVDIARLLSRHDIIVTIATTSLNFNRFKATVDRDIRSSLPVHVLQLVFPNSEVGLPEGCESVDSIPSPNLIKNFMDGVSLLQKPIEEHIEEEQRGSTNPISCMVSDKLIVWGGETARKFGLPRILFDGTSCFSLLCSYNLQKSKVYESVGDDSQSFVIPGLPDPVEFTKTQLPAYFNPGSNQALNSIRKKVREAEEGAYGVLVNSFEDLEPEYVKEYRKVSGRKVWCVGPASLTNKDDLDKAQRGNKASIDGEKCLNWLNLWEKGSVVYACLGSLNRLTPSQLVELGLGLEASNRPFIWVIRGGYKKEELEEWLVEDGFEERVKGRGLLIRGWAPQVLILSHPSIGAFLTHCGWNSTLEGICAGTPMITWPLFAEQFYNDKFVVKVLKIGLSVGAEKAVHFGEEEKFGVLVTREQVKEAIEKIMDEGSEGEERRERLKRLAEAAKIAIEGGGSSYLNIALLQEDILQLA